MSQTYRAMSAFKGYTNDMPGENNNVFDKIIIVTIVCIEAPDVKSSPCGNTGELPRHNI